jgi:predicted phage-related endonuclease
MEIKALQTYDFLQGGEEWKAFRKTHFPASEAAAMLNESKYESRNELLERRATGKEKEVSQIVQGLFDKGHEAEATARVIAESIIKDELYPVTGSREVDGLPISASFDGLTMLNEFVWEHKLLNKSLRESLDKGEIPYQYKPQLEQQLLVSGAKKALFMSSDGTEETARSVWYESDPKLRHILISGWKQFQKDLDNYTRKAVEKVVGAESQGFPLVQYEMQGTSIVSNINKVLPAIKEIFKKEVSRHLETDQNFADKEVFNKAVKQARAKLKTVVSDVQSEFISYAEFEKTAKEIDKVLQQMQSQGEKQVKTAKELKKQAIKKSAEKDLFEHIDECNDHLKALGGKHSITGCMGGIELDFIGAMKNKRTIESLENAVDSLVAKLKIEISHAMELVAPNVEYFVADGQEYNYLFGDLKDILNQPPESFQAVVKSRIEKHEYCLMVDEAQRENARIDEARLKASKAKIEEARLKASKANKAKIEEAKIEEANLAENTIPEVYVPEKRKPIKIDEPEVPGCSIPHDLLHKLTGWGVKNEIPPAALGELEDILGEYFK